VANAHVYGTKNILNKYRVLSVV